MRLPFTHWFAPRALWREVTIKAAELASLADKGSGLGPKEFGPLVFVVGDTRAMRLRANCPGAPSSGFWAGVAAV